ncbi:hypothetical protein SDJN02_00677, partial [Cucurbita argyrosperma subsp. argyrosperma]
MDPLQKLGELKEELAIKRKYSIKLYNNNKSDINIAHNPIQHNKTKHIKVARHFIKEKLEKRIVYMSYMPHSFNFVEVELMVGRVEELHKELCFHLEEANTSYKARAYAHQRDVDFNICDLVMGSCSHRDGTVQNKNKGRKSILKNLGQN